MSTPAQKAAVPESVRRRVKQMLNNAVNRGRMVRHPCEVCGSPKSEGHHDDYSKPFEVRWRCRKHHNDLHPRDGELGTLAKLTDDKVREIRRLRAEGMSGPKIAALFGIDNTNVYRAAKGITWKNVK